MATLLFSSGGRGITVFNNVAMVLLLSMVAMVYYQEGALYYYLARVATVLQYYIGAWTACPPTKSPVNILSQTKCPPNISPQVTFCPSDTLSPIYNVPRFYVHP